MGLFETWGSTGSRISRATSFSTRTCWKHSFVGRPPGATEGLDWVAQGDTLAELSQQLGIPAAELEATVARFNAHARRGDDLDFGRHPDSLGPVEKPPFYGVDLVTPDPFWATITIVVNRRAQVLHHATQQPILGLYACANMVATDRRLGVGYQAGCQLTHSRNLPILARNHPPRPGGRGEAIMLRRWHINFWPQLLASCGWPYKDRREGS